MKPKRKRISITIDPVQYGHIHNYLCQGWKITIEACSWPNGVRLELSHPDHYSHIVTAQNIDRALKILTNYLPADPKSLQCETIIAPNYKFGFEPNQILHVGKADEPN